METDVDTIPPDKRLAVRHAFISHSSKDHELAERVCGVLESRGLNCWIAPRDIDPGAPYDEEILRGIDCTQTFILLLSDAANASPHVKRELMVALRAGHAVYPIRIQEVRPGPKLEYLLEGIHWVDAVTPPIEAHLDRLAQLIAGYSMDADGTPRARERNQPRKERNKGRMVFVGIAAALAALAVGWFALVRPGRPPSPPAPTPGSLPAESGTHEETRDTSANQEKMPTPVNHTVVLCWAEGAQTDKRYPSSDQILDEEGEVLGELHLARGPAVTVEDNRAGLGRQAYLDFVGSTGKVRLCVFRVDDPVGQTRVAKIEGLFFLGRVMEVKNNKDGHIGSISIQVHANSSKQPLHERAAITEPMDGNNAQVQAKSGVNATMTLSLCADQNAGKRYPSFGQVLDVEGGVLGDIRLTHGGGAWPSSLQTAVLTFRGPNEETKICDFRFDDPIGVTRVGKVVDASVSSRLVELKRAERSGVVVIDTVAIEVSVKR